MGRIKQPSTRLRPARGFLLVEKRKHPRYRIELPFDYSVASRKATDHWGFAADASEGGLLVYLPEKVEVGAILKIEMYYAKDLPLKKIKATAKVAWSDLAARESFCEYRYGLQLRSIGKGDLHKLKILLREVGKFHASRAP